jgi:nitrite reductase/ring-hydroxylating ferredoxin subunit
VYKSAESLIQGLKDQGFKFTFSKHFTEGIYSSMDAEWNYKDVPHLKVVHDLVEGIPGAIEDDFWSGFFVQKVGPLRFPIAVFNSGIDRNSNIYCASIGPFALVIKTFWTSKVDNFTNVETQYSLGSLPYFVWAHKFIHRILGKNYEVLMAADIPMRVRRGDLRSKGYSFKSDASRHSFQQTMNVYTEDVVIPKNLSAFYWSCAISDINEGETLIGDNCLLGLRITRHHNKLFFYPRICMHAGAALDNAVEEDNRLSCPWHGKLIEPYAEIEDGKITRAQDPTAMKISVRDGQVTVESRAV